MSSKLFERHRAMLDAACRARLERGYWSAFQEIPSARFYGEGAAERGKAAFDALCGKDFQLDQVATTDWVGEEISPYGFPLEIKYPKADPKALVDALAAIDQKWQQAGPEVWCGIALEILTRLNQRSFDIAHAVMHTTGQAFAMAFQAGGPHAQDRGLEAVAHAWDLMQQVPPTVRWEKPQGKHPALVLRKHFHIVPRGVGLVVGCCTFPTWNSYPGLFANLATGNKVIVKPHPGAVLPLAITVSVARTVLQENGFDSNIVTLLAHGHADSAAFDLISHPAIELIDFTGSSQNGRRIERDAHQAHVFTEKAGINQIVMESVHDYQGMLRNIAFSLALYSGQMCTTPQNIYVPRDGIATTGGHKSFDQVVNDLAGALDALLGDPVKAADILGAIQNPGILANIDAARKIGELALDSRAFSRADYPDACVRTPLLMKVTDATHPDIYKEHFGPVAFCIATSDAREALSIAGSVARLHGGLTLSVYSSSPEFQADAERAAIDGRVALSLNLTGAVYVNQSAAFSDYHGTGANPAANATLTDAAFVANRFRVVQTRTSIDGAAAGGNPG